MFDGVLFLSPLPSSVLSVPGSFPCLSISSGQIRGAFLLSPQYLHFIPQEPLRAGLHLVFCSQGGAGVGAVSCGSCELI